MIKLSQNANTLLIDAARGANPVSWTICDQELFHVDQASYRQPGVKFKGGNPVMFPVFSTLTLAGGNSILYDGRLISQAQHGLARVSSHWKALQSSDSEATLILQHNQETLAGFPWPFEFKITYALRTMGVDITQEVHNPGESTLPFVAGFHPFFKVSDPRNCEVNGIPFGTPYHHQPNVGRHSYNLSLSETLRLGHEEVNHHFRCCNGRISLHDRLTGRTYHVDKGVDYPCISVWSEPGQPFVCVEPNTARRGAFETREDLLRLPPRGTWKGKLSFSIE